MLRELLIENPQLSCFTDGNGRSLLHHAAVRGHTLCVLVLLEAGGTINVGIALPIYQILNLAEIDSVSSKKGYFQILLCMSLNCESFIVNDLRRFEISVAFGQRSWQKRNCRAFGQSWC